jgi:predicted TIM-barrel fold metal-dependent hydrolase
MIIDGHVHFWDLSARHHDWLAAHPRLQRRFGPEDLDAGRHELSGALFVEADCRTDEALDEVRWVRDLARDHPLVLGIVAYAPLQRGRAAEQHLAALALQPLVVGVRRLLQGHAPDAITDPTFICGVRLLPEWGLSFDLCATHDQLPAVARLVEACPGTTFVLDHLGKPPVSSGRLDPWRTDLARIASFPNVACKLSGLATEATAGWRAADVRPYLQHALEVFGAERCMIASDWPVAMLATTVERWFDVVIDVLAELSSDDRRAVLSGTAMATYGLAPVGDRPTWSRDACSAVRR